ncbi:MAG: hypothetical protein B6D56_06320, partial [Candidatus Omnitrophica bacterium 4484_70.1]
VAVQRGSSFSLKKEFGNIDIVSYDGGEVSHLIEALRDEDSYVRSTAAKELDKIGWQPQNQEEEILYFIAKHDWEGLVRIGYPAVPYLIKLLKDKDSEMRYRAVKALGEIGSQEIAPHLKETIIKALIEALRDKDSDVRSKAAEELDRIGWQPQNQEEKILYLIAKHDWEGLVRIGSSAVPYLIKLLKDKDSEMRYRAAKALGEIGSQEIASHLRGIIIKALIEALKDEEWIVHHTAAGALVKIGFPAIPYLIEALRDEDINVRFKSAEVLDQIEWQPQNQEEEILYFIAKHDWEGLVRIGYPAVPYLIKLLKNKDSYVRYRAVKALGEIGSQEIASHLIETIIKALIEALKDEKNSNVRQTIARALGKVGSQEAVPHLIEALKDEDSDVCKAAAEELDKIGWQPQNQEEEILYFIAKHDWNGLVRIGYPAVPYLIKLLKDEDSEVRKAAAEALGKIGSPEAVPHLIEALKDKDSDVCKAAAEIASHLIETIIEALIEALKDRYSNKVRQAAAKALEEIGSQEIASHLIETIIEALIEALKDGKNSSVRQAIARALGKVGSQEAVPHLIEALKGKDSDVCKAAAEALGKEGIGYLELEGEELLSYFYKVKNDLKKDSSFAFELEQLIYKKMLKEEGKHTSLFLTPYIVNEILKGRFDEKKFKKDLEKIDLTRIDFSTQLSPREKSLIYNYLCQNYRAVMVFTFYKGFYESTILEHILRSILDKEFIYLGDKEVEGLVRLSIDLERNLREYLEKTHKDDPAYLVSFRQLMQFNRDFVRLYLEEDKGKLRGEGVLEKFILVAIAIYGDMFNAEGREVFKDILEKVIIDHRDLFVSLSLADEKIKGLSLPQLIEELFYASFSNLEGDKNKDYVYWALRRQMELGYYPLVILEGEDSFLRFQEAIEELTQEDEVYLLGLYPSLEKDAFFAKSIKKGNKVKYSSGIIPFLIEKANKNPHKNYYLVLENIEAISPSLRGSFNSVLWERRFYIPELNKEFIMPSNLHLIFVMDGEARIEDEAFLNRLNKLRVSNWDKGEMKRFLEEKYEAHSSLSQRLISFYLDLKAEFGEKYFSLRDLINVITTAKKRGDLEAYIKEEIYRYYSLSFSHKEEIEKFDKIYQKIWGDIKESYRESEIKIVKDEDKFMIVADGVKIRAGKELEEYLRGNKLFDFREVVFKWQRYILRKQDLKILSQFIRQIVFYDKGCSKFTILEGISGEGKTALTFLLGKLLGKENISYTIHKRSSVEDLIGGIVLKEEGLDIEKAIFLTSLDTSKVINFSELNTSFNQNIGYFLTPEFRGYSHHIFIELPEQGLNKEEINPSNIFIADINPIEYSARERLPHQSLYSARVFWMGYDYTSSKDAPQIQEELGELVSYLFKIYTGKEYPSYSKKLSRIYYALERSLAQNKLSLYQVLTVRELIRTIILFKKYGEKEEDFIKAVRDVFYGMWMEEEVKEEARRILEEEGINVRDYNGKELFNYLLRKGEEFFALHLHFPEANAGDSLFLKELEENPDFKIYYLAGNEFTDCELFIGGGGIKEGKVGFYPGGLLKVIEACYKEKEKNHLFIIDNFSHLNPDTAVGFNRILQEGVVDIPSSLGPVLKKRAKEIGKDLGIYKKLPSNLKIIALSYVNPYPTLEDTFSMSGAELSRLVSIRIESSSEREKEEDNIAPCLEFVEEGNKIYLKSGEYKVETNYSSQKKHEYLVPVEEIRSAYYKILKGINQGKNVFLLEGLPGVGKTALVEDLTKRLVCEFKKVSMYRETDLWEFLGKIEQVGEDKFRLTATKQDGRFISDFLRLLEQGGVFCFDEANISKASLEVISFLIQVAKREAIELGLYHQGIELGRKVKIHPKFLVFLTYNPSFIEGRREIPSPILSLGERIYIESEWKRKSYQELITYYDKGKKLSPQQREHLINLHIRIKEMIKNGKLEERDLSQIYQYQAVISPREIIRVVEMVNEGKIGLYEAILLNYPYQFCAREDFEEVLEIIEEEFKGFKKWHENWCEQEGEDFIERVYSGELKGLDISINSGKDTMLIVEEGAFCLEFIKRFAEKTGKSLDIFWGYQEANSLELVGKEAPEFSPLNEEGKAETKGIEKIRGFLGQYLKEGSFSGNKEVILYFSSLDILSNEDLEVLNDFLHTRCFTIGNKEYYLPENVHLVVEASLIREKKFPSPFFNRFQKIFLSQVKEEEIRQYLQENYGVSEEEAEIIVKIGYLAWYLDKGISSSEHNRGKKRFSYHYGFSLPDIERFAQWVAYLKGEDKRRDVLDVILEAMVRVYVFALDEINKDSKIFIQAVLEEVLNYQGINEESIIKIGERLREVKYREVSFNLNTGQSLPNGIRIKERDGYFVVETPGNKYRISPSQQEAKVSEGLKVKRLKDRWEMKVSLLEKIGGIESGINKISQKYALPPLEVAGGDFIEYEGVVNEITSCIFWYMRRLKNTKGKLRSPPPIFLLGPTGGAKSTLVRNLSGVLGLPLYTLNCFEGMGSEHIIGSMEIGEQKVIFNMEKFFSHLGRINGEYRWPEGKFIHGDRKILFLDEANISPRILYLLRPLFEGEREFTVYYAGMKFKVELDEEVIVILAGNPEDRFAGRKSYPEIILNKAVKLWVPALHQWQESQRVSLKDVEKVLRGLHKRKMREGRFSFSEERQMREGLVASIIEVKEEKAEKIERGRKDFAQEERVSQEEREKAQIKVIKKKIKFGYSLSRIEKNLSKIKFLERRNKRLYFVEKILPEFVLALGKGAVGLRKEDASSLANRVLKEAEEIDKDLLGGFLRELYKLYKADYISPSQLRKVAIDFRQKLMEKEDIFLFSFLTKVRRHLLLHPERIKKRISLSKGEINKLGVNEEILKKAPIFAYAVDKHPWGEELQAQGVYKGFSEEEGYYALIYGSAYNLDWTGYHELGHLITELRIKYEEKAHPNVELFSIHFPIIFAQDNKDYITKELIPLLESKDKESYYSQAAKGIFNGFLRVMKEKTSLKIEEITDNFEEERIKQIAQQINKLDSSQISKIGLKIYKDAYEKGFKGDYYLNTTGKGKYKGRRGVVRGDSILEITEGGIELPPDIEWIGEDELEIEQEIKIEGEGEAEDVPKIREEEGGRSRGKREGRGEEIEVVEGSWVESYSRKFTPYVEKIISIFSQEPEKEEIYSKSGKKIDIKKYITRSRTPFKREILLERRPSLAMGITVDVSGSILRREYLSKGFTEMAKFFLSLFYKITQLKREGVYYGLSAVSEGFYNSLKLGKFHSKEELEELVSDDSSWLERYSDYGGINTVSLVKGLRKKWEEEISSSYKIEIVFTDGKDTSGESFDKLREMVEEFEEEYDVEVVFVGINAEEVKNYSRYLILSAEPQLEEFIKIISRLGLALIQRGKLPRGDLKEVVFGRKESLEGITPSTHPSDVLKEKLDGGREENTDFQYVPTVSSLSKERDNDYISLGRFIKVVNRIYYKLIGEEMTNRVDLATTVSHSHITAYANAIEFHDYLARLDKMGILPKQIVVQSWGIGNGIFDRDFIIKLREMDRLKDKRYTERIIYVLVDFSDRILENAKHLLNTLDFDIQFQIVKADLSSSINIYRGETQYIRFNELYDDLPSEKIMCEEGKWFLYLISPRLGGYNIIQLKDGSILTEKEFLQEFIYQESQERIHLLPKDVATKIWINHIGRKEIDIESFKFGKIIRDFINDNHLLNRWVIINIGALDNLVNAISLLNENTGGYIQFCDYGVNIPREASFRQNTNWGQPTCDIDFAFLYYAIEKLNLGRCIITKQSEYLTKIIKQKVIPRRYIVTTSRDMITEYEGAAPISLELISKAVKVEDNLKKQIVEDLLELWRSCVKNGKFYILASDVYSLPSVDKLSKEDKRRLIKVISTPAIRSKYHGNINEVYYCCKVEPLNKKSGVGKGESKDGGEVSRLIETFDVVSIGEENWSICSYILASFSKIDPSSKIHMYYITSNPFTVSTISICEEEEVIFSLDRFFLSLTGEEIINLYNLLPSDLKDIIEIEEREEIIVEFSPENFSLIRAGLKEAKEILRHKLREIKETWDKDVDGEDVDDEDVDGEDVDGEDVVIAGVLPLNGKGRLSALPGSGEEENKEEFLRRLFILQILAKDRGNQIEVENLSGNSSVEASQDSLGRRQSKDSQGKLWQDGGQRWIKDRMKALKRIEEGEGLEGKLEKIRKVLKPVSESYTMEFIYKESIDRILQEAIKRGNLAKSDIRRILELGMGDGNTLPVIKIWAKDSKKFERYIGIDRDIERIEEARKLAEEIDLDREKFLIKEADFLNLESIPEYQEKFQIILHLRMNIGDWEIEVFNPETKSFEFKLVYEKLADLFENVSKLLDENGVYVISFDEDAVNKALRELDRILKDTGAEYFGSRSAYPEIGKLYSERIFVLDLEKVKKLAEKFAYEEIPGSLKTLGIPTKEDEEALKQAKEKESLWLEQAEKLEIETRIIKGEKITAKFITDDENLPQGLWGYHFRDREGNLIIIMRSEYQDEAAYHEAREAVWINELQRRAGP